MPTTKKMGHQIKEGDIFTTAPYKGQMVLAFGIHDRKDRIMGLNCWGEPLWMYPDHEYEVISG